MRFELDEALTDDILFHMENQNGSFMLDTQKGVVVNIEDCDDCVTDGVFDDEDRFVPLPNWTAQDGYRLMEKFTVELKNPLVRQELSAALNISKGVFRAFKNTLAQYPETEKLWNRRKRQKMKDEVAAWYNSQRETWGLEPVGSEPEDTLSLLLEDFVLRQGNSGDIETAAALHKLCIEQIEDKTAAAVFEKMNPLIFPVDFLFTAETASGDFAGFICAAEDAAHLRITHLEVQPQYRGMGLGKALLAKFLENVNDKIVTIDLPAGTEYFSRALHLENFKPCVQRFVMKI